MHVCLVSFDMPWTFQGGVEVHADRIAAALSQADDVTVVTREPPDEPRPYDVELAPAWNLLDGLVRPHWRYRLLVESRFAEDATSVAADVDADVVHFQGYAGRPQRLQVPTVATVHVPLEASYEEARRRLQGEGALPPRLWLQERIHRRRLDRASRYLPALDRVVTVNERFAADLRDGYDVTVGTIPNGVDPVPHVDAETARRRQDLGDRSVVLFLGRLEDAKDPLSLLDLLDRDVEIVYAGTGSLADRVEEAAARHDAVRYLGYVDEETKHELLAAADVFALPSRSEGQPIAILEALAHGTPVHTTREEWVPAELRGHCTFGDIADRLDETLAIDVPDGVVPTWDDIADRYRDLYDEVRAR